MIMHYVTLAREAAAISDEFSDFVAPQIPRVYSCNNENVTIRSEKTDLTEGSCVALAISLTRMRGISRRAVIF